MKTNKWLVEFAKRALAEGWVYWYGTVGYKCTHELLIRKTKQYPEHYTGNRMPRYESDISAGKYCADCINLAKAYMWLDEATGKQIYGSNGCPDTNADGMYNKAKEKGDIRTLPEIPGIMLHLSGHAGIYIGNGWAIEARGFKYGVVKTRVSERGWLHWYKMPGVTYEDGAIAEEIPQQVVLGARTLKKGSKGDDVMLLQELLIKNGYSLPRYGADGDYGMETVSAVAALQDNEGLEVDGIYGKQTHAALMALSTPDGDEAEEADGAAEVWVEVTGGTVYVRKGAGTGYGVLTIAKRGDKLRKVGEADGWHAIMIGDETGWIGPKYTRVCE